MHLICGEVLYDVFVGEHIPDPGAEIPLRAVAGGSPFNVAIGMARLGARVAFASDLARDLLGDRIAAQLAVEGVDDRFWRRGAAATALAIVATGTAGQPSYSFLGLEHAIYGPDAEAIATAGHAIGGVHVGSIATVLPGSADLLHNLVRDFADRALISFDPNVRLSIEPDLLAWERAVERFRRWSHVIKASEEDIAALYGEADAAAICASWLNDRTALVVLTRGEGGATLFTRANLPVEVPASASRVVDTVGAGDSFMAALLSTLRRNGLTSTASLAALEPDRLFEIGSDAAMAAGITCSRRGPILPTAAELAAQRATASSIGGAK